MRQRRKMTFAEKKELESYRETGLSPRQIKSLSRMAADQREYIEWLENL